MADGKRTPASVVDDLMAKMMADPAAAMVAVDAHNAERAAALRAMTPVQATAELKSARGCDGCPSEGPLVAECRGGCGDKICAACVATWFTAAGTCHICDETDDGDYFNRHMRSVAARYPSPSNRRSPVKT